MGFEQAEATLIGEAGRGLQTLFHMLLLMRLSCAPQGVGVAEAALATATGYARDRPHSPATRRRYDLAWGAW